MNIIDYNYGRLYFWYQGYKKNFDHKRLIDAAIYAITLYITLLFLEIGFAIFHLFNFDINNKVLFMVLLLSLVAIPVFILPGRYEEVTSQKIIRIYSELEKESHERLRSSTWLWFWIIQLFCLFYFFYHSSIAASVINQLKNYF
ncbi:MAG TPA: hypothetical protein PLW09_09680 [Candidatus Kapabacteria bacterium]|nr:hypothetical protein [Candidatus Kapabacteria bacterium]